MSSTPTPSAFGSHLSPCPGERKGAKVDLLAPFLPPFEGGRWLPKADGVGVARSNSRRPYP